MESEESSALTPSASAGRGSRRWLLLYNCQAQGLTYCLGLLGRDLQVDCFEVPTVQANAAAFSRMLGDYDRVLVLPQVRAVPGFEIGSHPGVRDVPSFVFTGYHPDLFRLRDGSGVFQGPMGNFHSVLAYAGWRLGLGVDRTVGLFREPVFHALGYFDWWTPQREALLARFASVGLDLRSEFHAWSRRGPFMHNPIHPHMVLLRDLARKLLLDAGVSCRDTDLMPHDNLVNGTVFPVYPPIATRLGFEGSFMFKPQGRYQMLDLQEFVARSFAAFDRSPEATPADDDAERISASLRCLSDLPSHTRANG